MSSSMRSRTAFCPHGFLVPGLPEPWLLKRAEGGEEIKASRFCLKCWDRYGQVFLACGYAQIADEDPCQYGFLKVIQYVLKDRAWYRDQDRYEYLETELRLHLLEQRELIEDAIRNEPETINAYVRTALERKLHSLQRGGSFQLQINSVEQELIDLDRSFVNGEVVEQRTGFDSNDESQLSEQIVEATGQFESSTVDDEGKLKARSHKAAKTLSARRVIESAEESAYSLDPLRKAAKRPRERVQSRKKEDAELVRAAIQEQSHRIDALTVVSRKEQKREIDKAHRQLLSAIDGLPHDEQMAIRMRFLDGQDLRDGKPRSRRDILRELRVNGNGASGWSEWDLRRFEQQAVIRLRQKVKLPSVFSIRD